MDEDYPMIPMRNIILEYNNKNCTLHTQHNNLTYLLSFDLIFNRKCTFLVLFSFGNNVI